MGHEFAPAIRHRVQMWWEWTLTDVDGNTMTTPRQTVTLTDDRFECKQFRRKYRLALVSGGDDVGLLLLDAAVAAQARLENEMGITLQDDVDLWIYGDSGDMRNAPFFTFRIGLAASRSASTT